MSTSLSTIRSWILDLLDEDSIGNSEFVSSGDDPWAKVDRFANGAEITVGSFLAMHGAATSMVLRSATKTIPAASRDVAWSTIDPTGALPGTKIEKVWDLTGNADYPVEIEIIDQDKADMLEASGIFGQTRLGVPRDGFQGCGVIIYSDRISILPVGGTALSVQFDYIPSFGKMSSTVDCALVDEAARLVAIRASADLLDSKERDSSSLLGKYERDRWDMVKVLHKGRAGTGIKLRGRRRGP